MERALSKNIYAKSRQSGKGQDSRYLTRFSLLRSGCRLAKEEVDEGAENKTNSLKEDFKDQAYWFQKPIKKLIDVGHALGHPIEDGLEDVQGFDIPIR
jgi:hypothetical protein